MRPRGLQPDLYVEPEKRRIREDPWRGGMGGVQMATLKKSEVDGLIEVKRAAEMIVDDINDILKGYKKVSDDKLDMMIAELRCSVETTAETFNEEF
jgi:hypothetical protein